MTLFPFYEDIEGKTFLVIGGGKVAKEKIGRLRLFTDKIIVVAKETDIRDADVRQKAFEDSDLALGDICIVATPDRQLNSHIAALCQKQGIPVNVVDDRNLCSFIFPSIVKRGDLTVSITTAGKSPAYAQKLRREIEAALPEHIEDILDRMEKLRGIVPEYIIEQRTRGNLYKQLLERMLETENRVTDEELLEMIKEAQE
ncbi:MAG: bifunctional precorrin-2 dehydrogenase/sirohydrochlorin ferrochelatase [Lachnospiraceae bacterium]|nr:bifunctional precorrin-2 dehydrogenase/sirohydrochlorin ferrochelatase [Lachnospiraceae bacterium]